MIQLMELNPSDDAAIKAYRLQVKARLYRFNKVSPHTAAATSQARDGH